MKRGEVPPSFPFRRSGKTLAGWCILGCALLALLIAGQETRSAEDQKSGSEKKSVSDKSENAKEAKPAAKIPLDTLQIKAAAAEEEINKLVPAVTECRWAASPIKIDGVADEKAWSGAPVIDKFMIPWLKPEDARDPRTSTKAKVLWDKEYFYFTAEMEDSDLYADVKKQDGDIWTNDVFEIFFKPSTEKPDYYEFEINALNAKLDMHLPRRNAGGFARFKNTHKFHIDSAVTLRGTLNKWQDKDEGWTVEGRIPWTDFAPTGGAPKVGSEWMYALCRYDYSVAFEGPELSTTAPLKFVNFHRWEDYTPLKFIGPDKTSQVWPHGLEKRVAWTTSRVLGSPEPPPPYRVKPTYPNLTLRQPLSIYPEPGTDKLMLIQHNGWWAGPGSIVRLESDENSAEVEHLINMDYIAYGLAYHPDYLKNGYLFVGMNGPVSSKEGKKTRVARYTVSREPPYKIVPDSELTIIEWESDGHNGGDLGFGPDGMLYVTAGDGTSDSDTNLTGQDVTNLCATMIRIDVDHPDKDRPYSIPPDNPFIGVKVENGEARPEIWAFGFRNPWRMTFDKKTGHLWVGQNGQDLWEQVIFVRKGENYGWSVMEGGHPFYLERKVGPAPLTAPLIDHSHAEARSLTGGIVYYGTKYPELVGAYIYGDWSTGKIWAVKYDGKKILFHREIADTTLQIGGFGVDHAGEILVLDQGGGKAAGDSIYRLEPTPEEFQNADFPRKLSKTGMFTDVAKHAVEPALISYSVNAPQWADGAESQRYMGLIGMEALPIPNRRGWNLPEGSVVMKTLSMEMEAGNAASRKRIETQILTRQQNEWSAYTYAWNDAQTDAELVEKEGREKVLEIKDESAPGGIRKQVWHFAARTDCMACHSRAANYLLGLTEMQLNKEHNYGSVVDNQLRTYAHIGLITVKPKDHVNTWFNNLDTWAAKPTEQLLWLANILEKPKRAKKASKYVAPPEDDAPTPAAAAASNESFMTRAIYDLNYALPAPLGWVRWGAVAARNKALEKIDQLPWQVEALPKPTSSYEALVNPYDPHADLEARARSYLHANCSQCHVNAGGGNAAIQLEYFRESPDTKLFTVTPKHDKFGLNEAALIAPGDPDRSVLLYRIAKLGGGRMPRVGSNEVDTEAVRMIREWIAKMPKAKVSSEVANARQRTQATLQKLAKSQDISDEERQTLVNEVLESTSGAMALLAAMDAGKFQAEEQEQILAVVNAHEQPTVRDLFERFVPLDQRIKRLGPNFDQEQLLALPGNLEQGKHLFFNVSTVQCKSCHRIGQGQEQMGPDLTEIGKKYTRKEILEHIVDPSKKIEDKYKAYTVLDSDGRVISGLIVKKTDNELIMKTAENKEVRLSMDEIEEMKASPKSIMPDQLFRDLTAEQAADILAYLASLKPTEKTAANSEGP